MPPINQNQQPPSYLMNTPFKIPAGQNQGRQQPGRQQTGLFNFGFGRNNRNQNATPNNANRQSGNLFGFGRQQQAGMQNRQAMPQQMMPQQAMPQQTAAPQKIPPGIMPGGEQNAALPAQLPAQPDIQPGTAAVNQEAGGTGADATPSPGLERVGTFMGLPEYNLMDEVNPAQPDGQRQQQKEPPAEMLMDGPKKRLPDELKEMIQNEHNGQQFYQNLSNAAVSADIKALLSGISQQCGELSRSCRKLYLQVSGEDFEPEKKEIIQSIHFQEGIKLAIKEETAMLGKYNRIRKNSGDMAAKETALDIICDKFHHISSLQVIYNEMR